MADHDDEATSGPETTVSVRWNDLAEIYRVLDDLVTGLARVGSDIALAGLDLHDPAAAVRLATWFDTEIGYRRLAQTRAALDSYFDDTVGADDMSALERYLDNRRQEPTT